MPTQNGAAEPEARPSFFEVSPQLIVPSTFGGFSIYLKQHGRMVLYAAQGDVFTAAHRARLLDMGVKKVWVESAEREGYDEYVRAHLASVVGDEEIPVKDRAEAWCGASETILRKMYDLDAPDEQLLLRFSRVRTLLRNTLKFFSDPAVLREMARFLRSGFDAHRHGLGVMVLTAVLLDTYDGLPARLMTASCAGAVLHDIGKSRLSEQLRTADPRYLDADALNIWRTHPSVGVSICSRLPLEQETLQCILFHHEREDGTGFPSGGRGADIPLCPRALGLCNAYDNLVRGGPDRAGLSPFEALSSIKEDRGAYDPDLLRRLITVLSKAELV